MQSSLKTSVRSGRKLHGVSGSFGTTGFSSMKESVICVQLPVMMRNAVILGKNAVYSGDPQKTGLNKNMIICGCSGSGKTMSFVEPRLLGAHSGSLFLSVSKRQIARKYAPVFAERGYRVLDLNLMSPEKSDIAYDPLAYISSCTEIRFLAECIVYSNPRKKQIRTEPYFDLCAIGLFAALCDYTLRQVKNATLCDVLDLLDALVIEEHNGLIHTSLDRKFRELEREDPNCYAMQCWNKFLQIPIRTAGCVLSTLSGAVSALFTPELRAMIAEKKTIDFQEVAKRKTIVFVSVSPVNSALHTFANLFFRQAIKNLFEFAEQQSNGRLPIPVEFLFDDFTSGSKLPNFPEFVSVFREKNMSAVILIQSESQLRSIYGEDDAITIINNCDTYLYTGGMDLHTCRNISERMRAPLDEILCLPVGKVVVFRRGEKPFVTDRYPILDDPLYRRVSEAFEGETALEGYKSRTAKKRIRLLTHDENNGTRKSR